MFGLTDASATLLPLPFEAPRRVDDLGFGNEGLDRLVVGDASYNRDRCRVAGLPDIDPDEKSAARRALTLAAGWPRKSRGPGCRRPRRAIPRSRGRGPN